MWCSKMLSSTSTDPLLSKQGSYHFVVQSLKKKAAKITMHSPFHGGHESSAYESVMDCAYVEPNEPQMIDITFIKSKHIWITCF